MPPPSVSLRDPPPSRGRLWTAQSSAQPANQGTCPCTTRISAFSNATGRGTRPLQKTANQSPPKAPHPAAQRPLTHLPISTHNPPPNEQTKERATAPRGYRPSLYERLRIFGVFRGSPPKRVFRAGPKWLWLLSPQKVMPVRRGQARRKASSHKSSV